MTSSNGDIFRVTGPLWGNLPMTGKFPSQKPVTRALVSLISAWTNGWVNNRDAGDLRRHRSQYDVTVMALDARTSVCFCYITLYLKKGRHKTVSVPTITNFGPLVAKMVANGDFRPLIGKLITSNWVHRVTVNLENGSIPDCLSPIVSFWWPGITENDYIRTLLELLLSRVYHSLWFYPRRERAFSDALLILCNVVYFYYAYI